MPRRSLCQPPRSTTLSRRARCFSAFEEQLRQHAFARAVSGPCGTERRHAQPTDGTVAGVACAACLWPLGPALPIYARMAARAALLSCRARLPCYSTAFYSTHSIYRQHILCFPPESSFALHDATVWRADIDTVTHSTEHILSIKNPLYAMHVQVLRDYDARLNPKP
jgi:hypothetical protein